MLLQRYNAVIREVAGKESCLLADVNKVFVDTLQEADDQDPPFCFKKVTRDDVHLNSRGNSLFASVVLETWGLR